MAQPATNPKIEELRARLKTDPKNRIFYPLAEELRKVGQFAESEQVLRAGLAFHPTYLSAWVSLGRVLRDLKNDRAAIEALSKAQQLDPGNVVAARLLGDAYLGLGEKVEAIKKYKLVQALLPGDEEIETIVEQLDRELNPPVAAPAPIAAPPVEEESPFAPESESPFDASAVPAAQSAVETPFAPEPHFGDETATMKRRPEPAAPFAEESPFAPEPAAESAAPATAVPASETEAAEGMSPFAPEPAAVPSVSQTPSFFAEEETPESLPEPVPEPPKTMPVWSAEPAEFSDAAAALQREFQAETATGDSEPMSAEHAESPFEEPSAYTADAFEVESPAGMHEARAPLAADVPMGLPTMDLPVPEAASVTADARLTATTDESDVFAPAGEPSSEGEPPESSAGARADESDLTNTLTMADLYAKQGLVADARQIYENILQRDPANEAVRAKLQALEPRADVTEEARVAGDDRVSKLERWLSKVGKREVGRV